MASANYTAVLSGKNDTTGIGLVEIYDLEIHNGSTLANISTRAHVQTGDEVLIGGIIVRGNDEAEVVVRAIGPSLAAHGVPDPLLDPVLELYNANGQLIDSNDDWADSPDAATITAYGLAPTDPKESALVFSPGTANYTAIVKGANNTTGVGLVEAYNLDAEIRSSAVSTAIESSTSRRFLRSRLMQPAFAGAAPPALAQITRSALEPDVIFTREDGWLRGGPPPA